jgi:hypothetical protein
MDISNALAPKSDQLDAVDLLGSPPQVFTITDVGEGNDEQPVNIRLAEFPRVWRPSKGMLRVLAHCWGKNVKEWPGRRVELYCDPDVMFGPTKVGGIRIQRLSHIAKRTSVPMIVGRGKSGSFTVAPLPDAAPAPPLSPEVAKLRAEWKTADPERREVIEAEVAALTSRTDGELVQP